MMKTMSQRSSHAKIASRVLRCCTVLAFGSTLIAAQSRIIRPQSQPNPKSPAKQRHVATIWSSDSINGSRVALTSDQSLSNYEAYRRDDRFYVKIPAADLPQAEAVRGRGFADVKAQRSGDSTVVSFRVQQGAAVHVEQYSNRLDVVITLPGARLSATPPSSNINTQANSGIEATKRASALKQNVSPEKGGGLASSSLAGNNPDRGNALIVREAGSSRIITIPTQRTESVPAAGTSVTMPDSKVSGTPATTPGTSTTATPSQNMSSAATVLPASHSTNTIPLQTSQTASGNFKDRLHYWILLVQLNPIPVGVGATILLLLITMFLFQRRPAKSTSRIRPFGGESKAKSSGSSATVVTGPQTRAVSNEATSEAGVTRASVVAAASDAAGNVAGELVPLSATYGYSARQLRVNRVAEQVRKLLAGEDFDPSVIASDDRDTRQMVGAELISALVGRNAERRERARTTFMQYGYFDEATRDLHIAESPNERAAAARRLSFVRDREATPHLIAALADSSPNVRCAAVEALMDLRDASAIGPLNSLMRNDTDRTVPQSLIKHAIEACAISGAEDASSPAAKHTAASISPESSHQSGETEREVIEL